MINNNEKDLYDMYGQYTENRQSTYKAQHQIRTSQPAADTVTMSLDLAKNWFGQYVQSVHRTPKLEL